MNQLIETLMYFVPALLVLGAVYMILKQFLQNEQKLKMIELRKKTNSDTLALKLQAYERLLVLLERITPSSMLLRVNQPGYGARQLHAEMLQNIRSEFEHNLSQQLYVSHDAWEMVKRAKDNVIHILNIAMQSTGEGKSAADLGKIIIDLMIKHDNVPTQMAIDYLKKEGKMFL